MNLFKTSGIILKIFRQKNNTLLLIVFSREYGKLSLNFKSGRESKSLDIGYIINFEISVRDSRDIQNIRNIKIISEFKYLDYNYSIIFEYMRLLDTILKKTKPGAEIPQIYEICHLVQNYDITLEKIVFLELKILDILGELDISHRDLKVEKILKFVNKSSPRDIIKLKGASDSEITILKNIINNTKYDT